MSGTSEIVLSRLQRKRLSVKTRRRGVHKGSRSAAKFGSSLEFSDFRAYQPGDDIRQIDWNVYGRTGKHYIKRFLDEQEIHAAIFLDSTMSMKTVETKWKRAKELAAALSYMALNAEDRLTFIPVADSLVGKIARKGAVYARNVYSQILQLPASEMAGSFSKNLAKANFKNIQLAILITDGLEQPENIEAVIRNMASFRVEVKLIQLLSRQEIEPVHTGDLRLVDSESKDAINVSIQEHVLGNYRNVLKEHNSKLESLCRKLGITYVLAVDDNDLSDFLFHTCVAKKVLE